MGGSCSSANVRPTADPPGADSFKVPEGKAEPAHQLAQARADAAPVENASTALAAEPAVEIAAAEKEADTTIARREPPSMASDTSWALNAPHQCEDPVEPPPPEMMPARPAVHDGKHGAQLGVRVGWLRQFARLVAATNRWQAGVRMTTLQVVQAHIKPYTLGSYCRYADLQEVRDAGAVGVARAFASHCWGGYFDDLVAAIAHVLDEDEFCWVDVFAVNQHPGEEQKGDLDFVPVVQGCAALLLCAEHLPSVAQLDPVRARQDPAGCVAELPKEERARCAFLRVWCLVELAAALAGGVPVVMLIGGADGAGGWAAAEKSRHDGAVYRFQDGDYHNVGYRPAMAETLRYLVDVERAEATVASDVSLILDDRMPEILEVDSRAEATARVNRLAQVALCHGADITGNRPLLRAVVGDDAPLLALPVFERRQALILAASAGFGDVAARLMAMEDVLIEARDRAGNTPLIQGSAAGQAPLVAQLLEAKADPNVCALGGLTPLLASVQLVDAPEVVDALLSAGAQVNYQDEDGMTALHVAALLGHVRAAQRLLHAGASTSLRAQWAKEVPRNMPDWMARQLLPEPKQLTPLQMAEEGLLGGAAAGKAAGGGDVAGHIEVALARRARAFVCAAAGVAADTAEADVALRPPSFPPSTSAQLRSACNLFAHMKVLSRGHTFSTPRDHAARFDDPTEGPNMRCVSCHGCTIRGPTCELGRPGRGPGNECGCKFGVTQVRGCTACRRCASCCMRVPCGAADSAADAETAQLSNEQMQEQAQEKICFGQVLLPTVFKCADELILHFSFEVDLTLGVRDRPVNCDQLKRILVRALHGRGAPRGDATAPALDWLDFDVDACSEGGSAESAERHVPWQGVEVSCYGFGSTGNKNETDAHALFEAINKLDARAAFAGLTVQGGGQAVLIQAERPRLILAMGRGRSEKTRGLIYEEDEAVEVPEPKEGDKRGTFERTIREIERRKQAVEQEVEAAPAAQEAEAAAAAAEEAEAAAVAVRG